MEMSQSHHKIHRSKGFSLAEVLIAIFILTFGLLAVAGLMSQMTVSTNTSRSSGMEVLLASEKLEDLNQYGVHGTLDSHITPGGSLTTNTTGYYDTIQVSSGQDSSSVGDIVETTIGTSGGSANYTQVKHSPNGSISVATTTGTPPTATSDMMIFDRRWLIEQDAPVTGVYRVTVWVQLQPGVGAAAQPFQTSMVRPYK
jgi:hypothetical protein